MTIYTLHSQEKDDLNLMRFNGEWLRCDDEVIRPVMRAEVELDDGTWIPVRFLVDTGADQTVFSADVLSDSGLEVFDTDEQLAGTGGTTESVIVKTVIRMKRDDGVKATFRGQFAACTQFDVLDMSLLGRDSLNLFAVIVDRARDTVALIGGKHRYEIRQA